MCTYLSLRRPDVGKRCHPNERNLRKEDALFREVHTRTADPCVRHSANSQRPSRRSRLELGRSKPTKENPPLSLSLPLSASYFICLSLFYLSVCLSLSLFLSFSCLELSGNAHRFRTTEIRLAILSATSRHAYDRSIREKRRPPRYTSAVLIPRFPCWDYRPSTDISVRGVTCSEIY